MVFLARFLLLRIGLRLSWGSFTLPEIQFDAKLFRLLSLHKKFWTLLLKEEMLRYLYLERNFCLTYLFTWLVKRSLGICLLGKIGLFRTLLFLLFKRRLNLNKASYDCFIKWANPGLFCLFSSISHYNFNNTNWKKQRWCAWDSNCWLHDGRRRRTMELWRPPKLCLFREWQTSEKNEKCQ